MKLPGFWDVQTCISWGFLRISQPWGENYLRDITGFPHFFISIFQGLFQDFSRSKLRCSRTIICGKNMLSGMEIFKKIIDSNFVSIFKEVLEIYFFHFPGFSGCVGTLQKQMLKLPFQSNQTFKVHIIICHF